MQECFPNAKLQAEMTQELHKESKDMWNICNFVKVN